MNPTIIDTPDVVVTIHPAPVKRVNFITLKTHLTDEKSITDNYAARRG